MKIEINLTFLYFDPTIPCKIQGVSKKTLFKRLAPKVVSRAASWNVHNVLANWSKYLIAFWNDLQPYVFCICVFARCIYFCIWETSMGIRVHQNIKKSFQNSILTWYMLHLYERRPKMVWVIDNVIKIIIYFIIIKGGNPFPNPL